MPYRRINITVDPQSVSSGGFTYTPQVAKIKRGAKGKGVYDGIEWRCNLTRNRKHRGFAIHFIDGVSPCDKVRYRTTGNSIQAPLNMRMVSCGRFPYFVTVVDNQGRIWTDDPDIIVW